MTELEFPTLYLLLGLAAFMAGYVDAVVGGGGLIQVPALMTLLPTTPIATLFGTNKIASIVGTASAAIQYGRRVRIPWRLALPGALAALLGSWFGARAVSHFSPELLRPVVLLLLIAVAIYTFLRKDFGAAQRASVTPGRDLACVLAIGATIGFYDGFFGPGTGSFFIFLLVRFLAMDFLHASATAKVLNVSTNVAAIAYFSLNVEILWFAGAVMAACNLSGALVGSRMAIRRGPGFVRKLFLAVVSVLIVKMSFDVFGR